MEPPVDPLGREEHHEHERRAVHDALDPGEPVADGGVQRLAHRHHDGRADERAPLAAHAAHEADHQRLHDHEHAEDGVGRDDEEDGVGVNGADDGGRRGAQRVGDHLGPERVDARRLRRLLVRPQRAQRVAEPRALDPVREQERAPQRGQGEEVVGARIAELHVRRGAVAHHRDRNLLVAQELHADPEDQRVGEGGQREVDAGEPERGQADEHGGDDGGHHPGGHPDPRGEARGDDEQDRDVGADAEERLVPEGRLARVAADDVPGEPHRGPHEHERQHAMVVALGERERQRDADEDDQRDRQEPSHQTARSRWPKRPWGRR